MPKVRGMGFPGGSVIKNPFANAGLTPNPGRSPGEGKGTPLQYSCLVNLMDWGGWWAIQSTGSQRVRHDLATEQQGKEVGGGGVGLDLDVQDEDQNEDNHTVTL